MPSISNPNCFHVMVVFGTRPEAIKMAPVVKELRRFPVDFSVTACVTAQHREMLDSVLNLFSIEPDYDLNIMQKNQSLFQIASSTLEKIQPVLEEIKPDIVLVQGDTSTAFIVSLAGKISTINFSKILTKEKRIVVKTVFSQISTKQLLLILFIAAFSIRLFWVEHLFQKNYQKIL